MKKVVVVGLGYVGLPIAVAFSRCYEVFGFDTNQKKIEDYKNGIDITGEVGNDILKKTNIKFSFDEKIIKSADYIIITVPTPVNINNEPDLNCIIAASQAVGRNLHYGVIVIYESTVYPGATEEVCVPILEEVSGLTFNKDFFVGYSPERINPGDKVHTFQSINKIVSGSTIETRKKIARLYQKCISGKIIQVSSLKVAEAAKVMENTQRDINIAFMNEISKIFRVMNINTNEVLQAAKTKWNFLDFHPGLVGGHCIGIDPYYLSYKVQELGYNPELILTSRKINNSMSEYVVYNIIDNLQKMGKEIMSSKILIKGLTFKENVTDIRNSRSIDIAKELIRKGAEVYLEDYNVNNNELEESQGLSLSFFVPKVDVVVFACKHKRYYNLEIIDLNDLFLNSNIKIIFDLYSIFNKEKLKKEGFIVWNL
ncbi:MAG: nucleotide sugar dehydrogenase [Anaeroplasmataceae bacterium]|nr:nucleotide sugar dehydrogenase [Anaeroplasmataceae bacterium]